MMVVGRLTFILGIISGLFLQSHGFHTYKKVNLSSYPDTQSSMILPKNPYDPSSCQLQCSMSFNFDKGCTATLESEDGNCTLLFLTGDSINEGNSNSSFIAWPRREISLIDKGEVFIVAGGMNGIGLYTTDLFSINGKCQTGIGLLPLNLFTAAFVILQNSLWLCGGGSYLAYNKDCWAFNFQTNTWVWKTSGKYFHGPLPAKVYKNKLYFIDPDIAEYYDPVNDNWLTWVPIPKSFYIGCDSVIWRDTMIVTGGVSFPNTFFIFNFTSNAWVESQNQTVNLANAALQILPGVDNLMLVVNYNNAALYDLVNGHWEQISNSVVPRSNAELISVHGRTFIMGGEGPALLDSIEEFHLSNKSWTTKNYKLVSPKTYPMAVKVPAFFFNC